MVQCLLIKGDYRQIAWIKDNWAKIGKTPDGWVVKEAYWWSQHFWKGQR